MYHTKGVPSITPNANEEYHSVPKMQGHLQIILYLPVCIPFKCDSDKQTKTQEKAMTSTVLVQIYVGVRYLLPLLKLVDLRSLHLISFKFFQ